MNTEAKRSDAAGRMKWVDIIKATSVVLVVLMHVVFAMYYAVDASSIAHFWTQLMVFLEPLRMPVFFVVSGILASSAVKKPWSWTKSRTVGILYLYLLWHTLLTICAVIVDLIAYGYTQGMLAEAFHTYFVQIFIPGDGYWYFYALVFYFVLARLLRNVNPWLVLGVAASVNLARPLVTEILNTLLAPLGVEHMMTSVVLNAVYFFAGVYLVQFFRGYAVRNDTRMLIGTGTIAVLGSLARLFSPEVAAGSFFLIAVAWALTAILIAVRLQDNDAVARFGASIGPRTLPIFVIQFLALEIIYAFHAVTGGVLLASSPMLQLIYPVVVTLAMVAGSLWIYEWAMRHDWSRLLFKAPAAWTAPPRAQPAGAQVPAQVARTALEADTARLTPA